MSSSSDSQAETVPALSRLGTAHQYERQNAGSCGSCHALANQTKLHLRAREPSAHHLLCGHKGTSVSEK